MTALKPCPFCGGEAEADTLGVRWIYCTNENCRASGPDFEELEDAAAAWNNRVRLIGEGWINPTMVGNSV